MTICRWMKSIRHHHHYELVSFIHRCFSIDAWVCAYVYVCSLTICKRWRLRTCVLLRVYVCACSDKIREKGKNSVWKRARRMFARSRIGKSISTTTEQIRGGSESLIQIRLNFVCVCVCICVSVCVYVWFYAIFGFCISHFIMTNREKTG